MLINDKELIKKYSEENRLWQGIPGIEVTCGGRMFVTFYSGGIEEEVGNYVLLYVSDDQENFSLISVIEPREGERCFDPCLWIDPLGRLWLIWNCGPSEVVCAAVCDNPDAEEIIFGEERIIGKGVMMNKPTVLSNGDWIFPIAFWDRAVTAIIGAQYNFGYEEEVDSIPSGPYVYGSSDLGTTITPYGYADIPQRNVDEHMVIELSDGTLQMFVRTLFGIGTSYSYDGGKTWTKGVDSTLGGPCSRFCIRRLQSGRIILVNHYNFTGRNNLTAMLSEDDGKTFPYKLLIDERDGVSYPDLKESDDGYIYIVYDRDRGAAKHNIETTLSCAREILLAKITEKDIINGRIFDGSELKKVVNKLGKYKGNPKNPYKELKKISNWQLAHALMADGPRAIDRLFDLYPISCINLKNIDCSELDGLIEKFNGGGYIDSEILNKIIKIVRSAMKDKPVLPVVERIVDYIKQHFTEEFSVAELARIYNCSVFHLCHEFKATMGITIMEYRNRLRLSRAKTLLFYSEKSISDIALSCGYDNASYFCEIFMREENVRPSDYRAIIRGEKG